MVFVGGEQNDGAMPKTEPGRLSRLANIFLNNLQELLNNFTIM